MIILAHLLKVEKYYQNKGIVVLDNDDYYLKLYVDFENIETIINNSSILINEDNYQYNIISISDLLESNYDNYQIFYLQILNPNKNLLVNNLVINYKILTGRESLIKYIKKIVIQSNTDIPLIRKYINKLGYTIKNEQLIIDKNIYYIIITFTKGRHKYTKKELYFGPILLKENNDLFNEKKAIELNKLEEILKKIPSKKIITKYKLKKLIKLYKN